MPLTPGLLVGKVQVLAGAAGMVQRPKARAAQGTWDVRSLSLRAARGWRPPPRRRRGGRHPRYPEQLAGEPAVAGTEAGLAGLGPWHASGIRVGVSPAPAPTESQSGCKSRHLAELARRPSPRCPRSSSIPGSILRRPGKDDPRPDSEVPGVT
jgi:hypothetical protein